MIDKSTQVRISFWTPFRKYQLRLGYDLFGTPESTSRNKCHFGKLTSGVLIFLCSFLSSMKAQNGDTGDWLMYFGQNRISNTLSIHSEIQFRNHTVVPGDPEQWLLRTGLNFHISPQSFITGGYAYITSYDFDGSYEMADRKEHRLWQQWILVHPVFRSRHEHRYRFEQRWVDGEFSTRARYRWMISIPINKNTLEAGTWFFAWYDEIFINLQQPYFDRNRFYLAFGYQWTKSLSFQAGMMHQQTGQNGKWYLQFAAFVNPDFRKN